MIKVKHEIIGNIVELLIMSKGKEHKALIDLDDLYLLDNMSVSMQRDYVVVSKNGITKLLHRLIKPEYKMVDHINRIPSDNRKENLRETNHSLNKHNSNSKNTTGFPNVTREGLKFRAFLRHNNRPTCLGRFRTPEEANDAVIKYKSSNNLL